MPFGNFPDATAVVLDSAFLFLILTKPFPFYMKIKEMKVHVNDLVI